MMLPGNALQPKTAKRIKVIIEIVDIKDGLIRTVRRQKSHTFLYTVEDQLFNGTLRQGSRNTFQKKMFQDLKTVFITQSAQYLVVSKIMVLLIQSHRNLGISVF